jgi:hypothetical protein
VPHGGGTGDTVSVASVQRPAEIVNYRTMGATPALLAAALAVGAIIALGLTLAASVRRRRRDLALLKTLGFTQRQLAAAVTCQASYAAVIGMVLGVPLGIAAGRWLWILFACQIYAVPHPPCPSCRWCSSQLAPSRWPTPSRPCPDAPPPAQRRHSSCAPSEAGPGHEHHSPRARESQFAVDSAVTLRRILLRQPSGKTGDAPGPSAGDGLTPLARS